MKPLNRLRIPIDVRALWSVTIFGAIVPYVVSRSGIVLAVAFGLAGEIATLAALRKLPVGRAAQWRDVALMGVFVVMVGCVTYYLRPGGHAPRSRDRDQSNGFVGQPLEN